MTRTLLWSGFGSRGETYPVLPAIQELRRRGWSVVALVPDAISGEIAPHVDAVRTDRFLPPPPVTRAPAPGPPQDLASALDGRTFLTAWHEAETRAVAADTGAELILVDSFRPGAAFAAERLGRPWVSYVHHFLGGAPIADGVVELHLQRFPTQEPPVRVFAEWWQTARAEVGLGAESRPESEAAWWILSPRATIVFGVRELIPAGQTMPSYVHHVGSTSWDGPSDADDALALSDDRPLVVISPTTAGDATLVAAAVEAMRSMDATGVITGGSPGDLPPNVHAVAFAPHGSLIPRASAVISNAGYGVVSRAACAGVPSVVVPRFGDQFRTADAVARIGIGSAVNPQNLSSTALQDHLADAVQGHFDHACKAVQESNTGRNAAADAASVIEASLRS